MCTLRTAAADLTPRSRGVFGGEYLLRLLPVAGGGLRELARVFGGNGSFNVFCWSRDSARLAGWPSRAGRRGRPPPRRDFRARRTPRETDFD